jgi:curved DNA-binding protein CbpA
MRNNQTIKRFDPYEILEISAGAEPSEIKKAHRSVIN